MKKFPIRFLGLLAALFLNIAIAGETNNDDVNILINKSIMAIQNKDYEKALSFINQAKNVNYDNNNNRLTNSDDSTLAEIYQMEGQLLEILGKKGEAISAWYNCLNYAKTDALKKEAEVHLKHLID
jgi:negative regulator of sigma E activity